MGGIDIERFRYLVGGTAFRKRFTARKQLPIIWAGRPSMTFRTYFTISETASVTGRAG